WSPDGTSAIFMADQGIWQVDADGSNLHLLWSPPPDGTGIDDGPTFTPDGRHIVFTRCCPKNSGYSLWMINSDGTGLKKVTTEITPPWWTALLTTPSGLTRRNADRLPSERRHLRESQR